MAETERRYPSARERDRGRDAQAPGEIPAAGWREIALRVWREISGDRVLLIAAGVTFYLLLALFPAMAAFVSLYGLVADPQAVAAHIERLGMLLPAAGIDIVSGQLEALATQRTSALGIGFLFGLAVALWSANGGMKSLFEAMNIAYDETEERGFFRLNLLALAFTLGAMVLGMAFILAIGVAPVVLSYLGLERWAEVLVSLLRWVVLLLAVLTGTSLLYRFGPSRQSAKWRWISWGAALATLGWFAASMAFSVYLRNFADYNATYGALGAVIGLMMWIWISVVVLIIGAEINAEMERQTVQDSTTGRPRPIGKRGAVVADTGGESTKE